MSPDRFKLVRELNGLTQIDLVRRIKDLSGRTVAQSTIAEIETGRLIPSSDLASEIAEATGFPLEFFEQAELPDFPSGSLVLYRAKALVSAKEEARARRHAQVIAEIISKLARRIDLLPYRVPQLGESPPVEAAQLTRTALGLTPDGPIENLIRTIELAGVVVLALPYGRDPVDAFSGSVGQIEQMSFIAVLRDAPADRQRWSVAHELGHLVLHQSMRGSPAAMEDDANRFAAEFLTPRAAMECELVPPITLIGLRNYKARWRVSMRSLINRAYEVGAITPRQRSYLFMKMNKTFGGRAESSVFLPERPRALRQMVEMVYGIPIDYERASFELTLSEQRLREIFDNYKGGTEREENAPPQLPTGNVVSFSRRSSP